MHPNKSPFALSDSTSPACGRAHSLSDVRELAVRVARLRDLIAEGRFHIDVHVIAAAIIDGAR